ncbi:MAG: putative transposase [Alloalcanivorax sp.]|jgi:putative transposase
MAVLTGKVLGSPRSRVLSNKDRLLLAGHPHRLVSKSQDQQPVFLDEADYAHCLGQIRELSRDYELAIHAFCLLPDGVHILTTPMAAPKNLSKFMKALSCRTFADRLALR